MKYVLTLLLIVSMTLSREYSNNVVISQTTQERLKTSFINLVNELRKVNSPAQNNHLLSKRINQTYDSLIQITQQLSSYNNVIYGGYNTVFGDNNIILGSYDNVIGSNNFVFVSRFEGEISGDLVVQNWKVQFDKRHLTVYDPNLVVSTLTGEQIGLYGRYVQEHQPLVKGVLCVVKRVVDMVQSITGESLQTKQHTNIIYRQQNNPYLTGGSMPINPSTAADNSQRTLQQLTQQSPSSLRPQQTISQNNNFINPSSSTNLRSEITPFQIKNQFQSTQYPIQQIKPLQSELPSKF